MPKRFLTAVDLGRNELQNAVVQNLASAPATPVKGQLYFDTTITPNVLYWWDGAAWQSAKGGTMAFGSITAETVFGGTSSDGVATTAARSDHRHGNPVHDAAAHAAIPLSALAAATATVDMGSQLVTNVGNAVNPTDAVNKSYVDNFSQGLDAKGSVRAATTANITLSAPQTIDGIALVANDRVLVKNQTTPAQNGIYVVQAAAWTRATDADVWNELVSAFTFVESGTTQADTGWVCTVDPGGTLGTTAITWVQFSGAGAFTAGAGMTQTGTTFDVIAANGSLVVAADNIQVGYAGSGGDSGAAVTAARSDHAHSALYPPLARAIATTAPLTGGGDLSANRTLAISNFAGSAPGAVPTSVGGTVNFLRADGTWATPPGTALGTVRSFAQDCAAALTTTVTHNFNTQDVGVTVYAKASPFDEVMCDVQHNTVNSVIVAFATAPTAAQYRIVVQG